jgi:hypothetical protein
MAMSVDIYSRRGAENNYRYKGRVTRDKEKQRRYLPFFTCERAEAREHQDIA